MKYSFPTLTLTAALLLCAPATWAQSRPQHKASTPVGAKTTTPMGEHLTPGATCEIGKTYRLGTGANQINLRVDSVELAEEYTHLDTAGKQTTEKSDPIHAWMLVRFTVQNAGAKKLPVWEETWDGSGAPRTPYVQMNAVRKYGEDDKPDFDYFELYNKDFYRASDGKILDTNGSDDKPNWLQPYQTLKAFAAFQIRKEATPIATHLQINYYGKPDGGGVGVGDPRMADEASKPTLMLFDVKKAVEE